MKLNLLSRQQFPDHVESIEYLADQYIGVPFHVAVDCIAEFVSQIVIFHDGTIPEKLLGWDE